MSTRRLLMVVLALVLVSGAVVLFRLNQDPFGPILRAEIPALPESSPSSSPYSEGYNRDMRRLINEMARRTWWSDQDVEWLVQIVHSGWPDIDQPKYVDAQDMFEAYSLYDMALTIVSERIGRSIPVPGELENEWGRVITENLNHPQWYVRNAAVGHAFNAGLLQQPEIAEQVRRMSENDPNQAVRENSRRRIEYLEMGDG